MEWESFVHGIGILCAWNGNPLCMEWKLFVHGMGILNGLSGCAVQLTNKETGQTYIGSRRNPLLNTTLSLPHIESCHFTFKVNKSLNVHMYFNLLET